MNLQESTKWLPRNLNPLCEALLSIQPDSIDIFCCWIGHRIVQVPCEISPSIGCDTSYSRGQRREIHEFDEYGNNIVAVDLFFAKGRKSEFFGAKPGFPSLPLPLFVAGNLPFTVTITCKKIFL